MCNSLCFAHEETRTVSTILTEMNLQIVGELNETYERYIFNLRNQRSDESIDEYVTELKHLSKSCNFSDCLCDSLLCDKLVMGIVDKETRKRLLQMKKLTLELCVDTCRTYEASTSQIAAIPDAVTVHRFRTSKPKPAQKQYKPNVMKCHFCGKQHEMLKSKCPA